MCTIFYQKSTNVSHVPRRLKYHAACKVEFQQLNRSCSQLTFFIFFKFFNFFNKKIEKHQL